MLHLLGLSAVPGTFLLGLVRGLLIGLAAGGIVLVYRSTRIINFAQAQIGAVVAAVAARLVVDHGVPFAVALPLALVAGALLGAGVDALVIARLDGAPRVVALVATVGLSELLAVAVAALPRVKHNEVYPTLLHRVVDIRFTRFGGPEMLVLGLAPAALAAIAILLARTPTGLAVRAAAQNSDAATLAGISPRRVSATVWGLAGALAALTSMLSQADDRQFVAAADVSSLDSTLLLSGLVAALAAGLRSLTGAAVAGLVTGEAIEVARYSGASPGQVDQLLLAAVLVVLAISGVARVRRGTVASADPDAALSLTRGRIANPIPVQLRDTWWAPRLGLIGATVAVVAGALVPLVAQSAGARQLATRVLIFAVLGLSVTVLTGWAGQLSLGQVAVFGVGAVVTSRLSATGAPFVAAVAAGMLVAVLLSLLVGVLSEAAPGPAFSIATFALSVAAPSLLFALPGIGDVSVLSIARPSFARTPTAYYLLCLAVLAVVVAVVAQLRGTGAARRIIASRANPRRAASLSVDVRLARLTAFGLSGALAGLAGGLLTGSLQQVTSANFPALDSLVVVALVAIGGFGSTAGPVLGAMFVLGLPAVYRDSITADALVAGAGVLAVLLFLPGGLGSLLARVQDALLDAVVRRGSAPSPAPAATVTPRPDPLPAARSATVVLAAQDVSVTFGGRRALSSVTLELADGELLALIGANGAGKSTLLSVLSGFSVPDQGRVRLRDSDITTMPPRARARLGMGRVFQDASLFGDLTVRESVAVALEAREPSELVPSLLGLPPSRLAERAKQAAATEVIGLLGLGRYAEVAVSRLSTGTRRLVELACLLGQDARVLLLDEPTAGLAQRETEAFAPLLLRLRNELGASILLVEHDLPLVRAVADRAHCLGAGETLAVGTVAEVLDDPAVIASYLGSAVTASVA